MNDISDRHLGFR